MGVAYFSRAWFLLFAAVFLCFSAFATEKTALVEGEQYIRLKVNEPPKTDEGKVEVREFFWYGCPHCYTLEPYVNEWLAKKPDYVTFTLTPAVLGESWQSHARVFYALRALGKDESLHQKFFDAIHKEQMRLRKVGEIADYFAAQGIPREHLRSAMKSLQVNLEVKIAQKLAKSYRLRSVPVFVVGEKYMTAPNMLSCSGDTVSCYRKFFAVVEQLAEKVRRGTD